MCETVRMPGGGMGIICGRRHRRSKKPCAYPGCRYTVEVLCDAPTGPKGGTCDVGTCRQHAKRMGPDRDFCWKCAVAASKQRDLFGAEIVPFRRD